MAYNTNVVFENNMDGYLALSNQIRVKESETTTVADALSNIITTAPSADNTTGTMKFVVLDTDPTTKYDGYIYLIRKS